MRLLATIRPETRDPERYQCLRCGHPACPAAASWVPREGQARAIHLPEPRTT